MKFVPKGPINNIPALVQIMAWRRLGDKPLSEPMMVRGDWWWPGAYLTPYYLQQSWRFKLFGAYQESRIVKVSILYGAEILYHTFVTHGICVPTSWHEWCKLL